MVLRRRFGLRSAVVVVVCGLLLLGLLGAHRPPSADLPAVASSVQLDADGEDLGCAQVLPYSREVQGERDSKDAPRPMVFEGRNLAFTNVGVRFPVVVWWLEAHSVVWTAHMSAEASGPFVLPKGVSADGAVELGPETWPGWDAVRVSFGSGCRP